MFFRLNTHFVENKVSSLLVFIALFSLWVTTSPPSTFLYLARADYARNSSDAVTSTVWLGIFGYCKTNNTNDSLLNHTHSAIQCFSSLYGYNPEDALRQDEMPMVTSDINAPESTHSTKGIIVANAITIVFCFATILSHYGILQKPTPPKYAAMFICSAIAFTSSLLTFTFASAFSWDVQFDNPPPGFTFLTGYWGLQDFKLFFFIAMLVISAANVMGFFSLIGAKYKCEGYAHCDRTMEVDDLEQRMNPHLHRHASFSEEKYSLLTI
ncbi:hypothetical protein F5Y03DRAFT_127545 [Xylaria venustula]|nr:hypothetical protein F5Y03DRAFT_127545 [Xylaria venustula]